MSLSTNPHDRSPDRLDAIFSALADPTRRSILGRLRDGSLTVGELAAPYGVSLNAISKHVKTLEKAGLIRREIRGREHACQLDAANLKEVQQWLDHYAEFWGERLDALDRHLAAKRKQKPPQS
ncbi:ArsR family transcriptional regulator [Burkholderia cepacia JBK9]|uniref:ArsR family transcriptional regulator n=1 Tax=Burkholderia arboris TaxID=488730 RepID=A0A9Q9SF93_9BURK|nr:metalloregulator ArsR/SmtB family transcription factor [Burkholderia arboris]ALX13621.1 ArsR family transcriptional regulator [Burkholderia cepacia JBK9]MCA8488736.1 metalloregulator ArsR/SmtB family transcription factor [Burkholderia arboris]UTV57872.1 metalloregulator ArsR/SmtB family transcription factor [Burkholderia arboris]VWB33829.1 ArsR family transcriptional regulator [Burkholderia arboris]